MVWIVSDRIFAASGQSLSACRCGMPALEEPCTVCEQMVCCACAAFVDPRSHRQERPSHLLARRISRDFLAHHACLSDSNPRMTAMIESRDIPHLVLVLRQQAVEPGLAPARNPRRSPIRVRQGETAPQRLAPVLFLKSSD